MNARNLLIGVTALGLATGALAQLDFGKLGDLAGKLKDNAKDIGKVVKGAAGIGPEEEKVIGDSVALEIAGKYGGLVRTPAVMQRVNLVGRSLARYSERPELNWRFAVLDSASVNAFSAPDGYVFITRGLFALAENDDVLAGILGHEIAHITGRHALKIVARGEFLTGATNLAAASNSKVGNINAQLQQFDVGIGKIATTLFEKGFDPSTEYEADRNGHDLAKQTGYAPGGLRSVLAQLQQRGGDPKKTFSTHPPLNERIKRLPDEPAPKT